MQRHTVFALASITLFVVQHAGSADTSALPSHWFISSQNPGEGARYYVGRVDHATVYSGLASGVLASTTSEANVSGTLMQQARASAYSGRTIVFSAYLKTRDVSRGTGLWLRADAANGLVVAFKNAWSRSQVGQILRGSTEWRKVELVIDVPSSAVALAYGVQMSGPGTVWIDHVRFEVRVTDAQAADATPLTVTYNAPPQLESLGDPANLDFEE